MLLLVFLRLWGLTHGQSSIDMEKSIPRNNWYTPELISGKNIPYLPYEDRQCAILEQFIEAMIAQYRTRGGLGDEEAATASDEFYNCKTTICSNSALVPRLSDYLVLAELVSVVTNRGRTYDDDEKYKVFQSFVDPMYWDILSEVPYPILEDDAFGAQQDAAYRIIKKVCGHQTPDVKLRIGKAEVNKIFLDVLVDEYIPGAFHGDEKSVLISATDPVTLTTLWNVAAGYITPDAPCLDPTLGDFGVERNSVSRIKETATEMGIENCVPELTLSGPSFGVAPGDSRAGGLGGAPGSPGSSSGGAPADSGGGGGFFAPGRR